MIIIRDTNGRARWVTYSSNAFRDSDGEIVSQKALIEDCDRADADGNYGPLRWWHLPGVDIGTCDFNAVVGRTLIESGTFKDDRIAEKMAKGDYQISIGFRHPINQPDENGVFTKIYRFERSVIPAGRVANRFTKFLTIKESNMASITEKWNAFRRLMNDDDLAKTIIEGAAQKENEADGMGIDWKEYDPEETETEKAKKPVQVEVEMEMDEEDDTEEEMKEDNDWDDVPVIGDMPLDSFAGMLAEAVDAGLEPVIKELSTLKEWQVNTEGGIRKTAQALKEAKAKEGEAFKEAMTELGDIVSHLETRVKELEAELGDARNALKELIGDQPNSSYRATEDPATVIGDNHRLKGAEPTQDPLKPFFDFVVNNGVGN